MEIKEIVLFEIKELLKENSIESKVDISDSTELFSTGLDSLSFATLVARLEERLNFDPFIEMQQAIYPETFGEFVQIYKSNNGDARGNE